MKETPSRFLTSSIPMHQAYAMDTDATKHRINRGYAKDRCEKMSDRYSLITDESGRRLI